MNRKCKQYFCKECQIYVRAIFTEARSLWFDDYRKWEYTHDEYGNKF